MDIKLKPLHNLIKFRQSIKTEYDITTARPSGLAVGNVKKEFKSCIYIINKDHVFKNLKCLNPVNLVKAKPNTRIVKYIPIFNGVGYYKINDHYMFHNKDETNNFAKAVVKLFTKKSDLQTYDRRRKVFFKYITVVPIHKDSPLYDKALFKKETNSFNRFLRGKHENYKWNGTLQLKFYYKKSHLIVNDEYWENVQRAMEGKSKIELLDSGDLYVFDEDECDVGSRLWDVERQYLIDTQEAMYGYDEPIVYVPKPETIPNIHLPNEHDIKLMKKRNHSIPFNKERTIWVTDSETPSRINLLEDEYVKSKLDIEPTSGRTYYDLKEEAKKERRRAEKLANERKAKIAKDLELKKEKEKEAAREEKRERERAIAKQRELVSELTQYDPAREEQELEREWNERFHARKMYKWKRCSKGYQEEYTEDAGRRRAREDIRDVEFLKLAENDYRARIALFDKYNSEDLNYQEFYKK